jgi:transcriptional regulator with XRE-family HTH domain
MDKREVGAFLRSRRERLRPSDVGLPERPRRRTPGLRREEVADRAHISTEYYVRIEQGRGPRPSADVLSAIRAALRLTDAESEYLHLLAGTVAPRAQSHRREVSADVLGLIERLPQTAAIVTSAAMEVLAWNDQATRLLEDFSLLSTQQRNLARMAFLQIGTGPEPLYGLSDLAEFRDFAVKGLRAAIARYPADAELRALIDELRTRSESFNLLWERPEVRSTTVLEKHITHPTAGAIAVACNTIALEERDQLLVLFTPTARSAAAWAEVMR